MSEEKPKSRQQGADLFVVDNSNADWKVSRHLKEWTDFASTFDIATGYFEIGALLALDGQWQKLEKLRILGWIPKGRKTERSPLPRKYQLQEMPTAIIQRGLNVMSWTPMVP